MPGAHRVGGRAYARRPPTTPDVRTTYPAFPVYCAKGTQRVSFRASCRLRSLMNTRGLQRDFRPRWVSQPARRSPGGFCSNRSESTRDCPLMTGSALRSTGAVPLLRPLLTAARPSQHLAMPVAMWQACSSPRVMRATFMLCPSDIRGGVLCKYRASHLLACLPTPPRLYPLPVRRTSILPAASFGFRIAPDTLAVRLPLPLAGCGGDSHPQVPAPPPRGCG